MKIKSNENAFTTILKSHDSIKPKSVYTTNIMTQKPPIESNLKLLVQYVVMPDNNINMK